MLTLLSPLSLHLQPCIEKMLRVLGSYRAEVAWLAEFKSCSEFSTKLTPAMKKLQEDMSKCLKTREWTGPSNVSVRECVCVCHPRSVRQTQLFILFPTGLQHQQGQNHQSLGGGVAVPLHHAETLLLLHLHRSRLRHGRSRQSRLV